MNCGKCSLPSRGKPARIPSPVKLKRTGDQWRNEEKFICPVCRAIFWFPKHVSELATA